MEDSRILELLKKKSPQTTLEVAKAAGMSWHVVQEQLLEMQIDGKLDRITVGRQNLWFVKGQKLTAMKGYISTTNMILIGLLGIFIVLFAVQTAGNVQIFQSNTVSYNLHELLNPEAGSAGIRSSFAAANTNNATNTTLT